MSEMVWTVNPATEERIADYQRDSLESVEEKLAASANQFRRWRATTVDARAAFLNRLGDALDAESSIAAARVTAEMGKPITQAEAEIAKCVELCRCYAEHADALLARQDVATEARASYVRFDPLGPVLGIMPWNFPYWQVFRWGVPTLLAGNTLVLSHADNVLGAATHIQQLFAAADAPRGLFELLNVTNDRAKTAIEDPRIRGVSLTGSVRAGRAVASMAAAKIKPTVLELGGSDPCLVLADADLDSHFDAIVHARFQNSGQTCIAAKRYLVEAQIADEFRDRLVAAVDCMATGDPTVRETSVGPLARRDLVELLGTQVDRARGEGLSILRGGRRLPQRGYYYEPTILDGVRPDHVPFREELFGPVASLCVCESVDQMVEWANATDYGLSASVWTRDLDRGEALAADLEVGCVFVNQAVKSDMRLPFGGVKDSGYGRELGGYGVREFANAKTVFVSDA